MGETEYPQEIPTSEELWPSHGKNNQLVQCLLHMLEGTNVVKLDTDFFRSNYSRDKVAFKLILCYVLQEKDLC